MRVLPLAVLVCLAAALPGQAVENQPDRTDLCKLDVDLVIDVSGSMDWDFDTSYPPPPGMPNRLDVTKLGASAFLNGLSSVNDRSALIAFSSEFYNTHPAGSTYTRHNGFTSSHGVTDTNVNSLYPQGGTTFTPALNNSHMNFINNGRPDARWMMVFLSDADNPNDPVPALAEAAAAKANGVEIITITAIDDAGAFALGRDLASDPDSDYAKQATSAAQMQQAWDEISDAVFKLCASFTADPQCHHLPVLFEDKSISPYVNDPIIEVYWDMGDGTRYGPNQPLQAFYHKYRAPGTYEVQLRVVTQDGNQATTTEMVTVCNDPPEMSIEDAEYFVRAGYPIFFQFQTTDANQDPTRVEVQGGLLATMSWDPDDKAFLWYPTETDVGVYDIYFEAVDYSWIGILPLAELTDSAHVRIHVVPPEQYPPSASDEDGDGVPDVEDNCPGVFNPGQEGVAGQGLPCATGSEGANDEPPAKRKPVTFNPEPDTDGDGVPNADDNCPDVPNADQSDADGDGVGDVCQLPRDIVDDGPDVDLDFDGIMDRRDNCPGIPNPFQRDQDGDGLGDECDTDLDGDGVPQLGPDGLVLDNCPYTRNPDQFDSDGDGIGDACQNDEDGDGVPTYVAGVRIDNCPAVPNADQRDRNGDGIGDACQPVVRSDAPVASQATPASLTPWVVAGGVGLLLLAAIALVLLVRPRP